MRRDRPTQSPRRRLPRHYPSSPRPTMRRHRGLNRCRTRGPTSTHREVPRRTPAPGSCLGPARPRRQGEHRPSRPAAALCAQRPPAPFGRRPSPDPKRSSTCLGSLSLRWPSGRRREKAVGAPKDMSSAMHNVSWSFWYTSGVCYLVTSETRLDDFLSSYYA